MMAPPPQCGLLSQLRARERWTNHSSSSRVGMVCVVTHQVCWEAAQEGEAEGRVSHHWSQHLSQIVPQLGNIHLHVLGILQHTVQSTNKMTIDTYSINFDLPTKYLTVTFDPTIEL